MHDQNSAVEAHGRVPPLVSDEILLTQPNIRIFGSIGTSTFWDVVNQIAEVRTRGDHLVLELTSEGGDADTARRIALEISLFQQYSGKQAYFMGKTIVYSAAVTVMAAFPISNRFLTADAVLLIHERRLSKSINLDGPMTSNIQILKEQLAIMETARRLENEGFEQLVQGSNLGIDTLENRARENYYLSADEALELGFVSRILKS